MKKILMLVCVFCLTASAVCAAPSAAKAPKKASCGRSGYFYLRYAGFQNYPPFSWLEKKVNANGYVTYEYHGFIYDLVMQSLKDVGLTYLTPSSFDTEDDMKKAIRTGNLGLLYTTYYADEAKSGLDYVYPAYFGNPFVVISRAEKPLDVDSVQGLKGMQGVVRNEEGVKPLIVGLLPSDTKIEWVDGPRIAFQKLLSGEADFMIGSPYAAVAEAKRFGVYDKIYISQKPVRSVKLFAAFPKLSACRKEKDAFAEKFNALAKDAAKKEELLSEAITQWVEQNKGEEPFTY